MRFEKQTTIGETIQLSGIGVHSGKPVSLTLLPAEAGTGIVFQRTNLPNGQDVEIPATFEAVTATALCTVIGNPTKAAISTVEHLMAALNALGIDNIIAEVDSDEVPVMDGSSEAFVRAIDLAGIKSLNAPRRMIRILKPVRFENGTSYGELRPYEGTRFEVEIDFDTPLIGRQVFASEITPDVFRNELCRARTFGFMKDVEQLWAAGYALGSSLDNTVVIGSEEDGDKVMNTEGLRYPGDEFVRHKTLDAIGDLALAGAPIMGLYRSYRGGHALNFNMLRTLFADQTAWEYVDAPAVRERGHASLPGTLGAAIAYGPDVS